MSREAPIATSHVSGLLCPADADLVRKRTCAMMVYCSFGSFTDESKVIRPFSLKLPFRAAVCVERPVVLATKGVQAPREAMHEWMLACAIS
jgi:hypothetical protein